MLEIKEISIRDNYAVMSNLMKRLHESEHEMFDKTAAWSDIEEGYMRHVMEMQEDSNGTCLMAYFDNQPAGFLFAYEEEQDDSRIEVYKGIELYVSDGYVLPEYRRQGIYKAMNAMIEDKYVAKGIKRITRYTQSANNRMQEFLKTQGYIPTRILYEKWL